MSFRSIITLLAILTGCATNTTQRLHLPALSVVAQVDLSRYVGTWYEIANVSRPPCRGQKGSQLVPIYGLP